MTSEKSSTQALTVTKENALLNSYFHRLLLSLYCNVCISEGLLEARLNCRHTKFTIIVCYAPTNISETRSDDVTSKDEFYNQLDDLTPSIPKHDVQISNRNMNDTSTIGVLFLETKQRVTSMTVASDCFPCVKPTALLLNLRCAYTGESITVLEFSQ